MSQTVNLLRFETRISLCKPHIKFSGEGGVMGDVFGNEDLLEFVLKHAALSPKTFVAATRVSSVWRSICIRDGSFILETAKRADFLTKQSLMGLLVINSKEADQLPREVRARRGGGVLYVYHPSVVDNVWSDVVGGIDGWSARLSERACDQKSIEVTFGPKWRSLQWQSKRQCVLGMY